MKKSYGDPRVKEKLRALPHRPGVYLMKDRFGQVLYVGKAKDLKKRVSSYFQPSRRQTIAQPKVRNMIPLIHDLEVVEVRTEAEAILLEGKLIKDYRPRYNTDFTDDKRFLLVRVGLQDPLPAFHLVRNRREDGARYFGPFARSGPLRQTLARMRLKFGILLGDAHPLRQADGRFLLYDDVRKELYGHPNLVTPEDYRQRVDKACDFLEGKTREWLKELESEMQEAAEKMQFEKAAALRDAVQSLRKTVARGRKFTRNFPGTGTEPSSVLRNLARILQLKAPPLRIESFDISHISGTFCVASMVQFRDGAPSRKDYRRFKIKSFTGNDDLRAMEEVVGRRYRRLHEEGQPLPDLILVDGGKGQVGAALKAFLILDLPAPPLVGLAKKKETLIFPDNRPPLNLSLDDPALRLLQRIRDEAHRFANTFNADLRSRRIRESLLDDFHGLGPVRRHALMQHFESFEQLRRADVDDLRKVPGIGPKLAAELHLFLRQRRGKLQPPQKPLP